MSKPLGEDKPMSKGGNRTVYRRSDGMWVNKRSNSEEVTGVHPTRRKAIEEVKWNLMAEGGGELTIIGEDGRIHSIDTISPGNSPSLPGRNGH